jgi:hypothetical protein
MIVLETLAMAFNPRLWGYVWAFLAFCALQSFAGDYPSQHFSGFASLGLVSNDNPDLSFRRDITQRDGSVDGELEWRTDSLVGLQWHADWARQLETTVQFVVKDRLDNSLEKSLEWGFLGYKPVDDFTLRVGRMGADIFLLSDYRQVNYAMPWVRPPPDYYGFISYYHFDGIDANKRFDFNESTLNIKLSYGNTNEEFPPSFTGSSGIELDFDTATLIMVYEWESWKFRTVLGKAKINNTIASTPLSFALNSLEPIWPEAKELSKGFNIEDKTFTHKALGIAYDNNVWWVQSEFSTITATTFLIPESRFFYASAGRHFGDMSVFITQGKATPIREPSRVSTPTGYPSPLAENLLMVGAGVDTAINSVRGHQDSIGVGVRWDFRTKMALKFQVDQFTIKEKGSNLWFKQDPALIHSAGKARVVSLSLDVLF